MEIPIINIKRIMKILMSMHILRRSVHGGNTFVTWKLLSAIFNFMRNRTRRLCIVFCLPQALSLHSLHFHTGSGTGRGGDGREVRDCRGGGLGMKPGQVVSSVGHLWAYMCTG